MPLTSSARQIYLNKRTRRGGKYSHSFWCLLKVYDETIRVLKSAVQKARLGQDEELGALKRLDDEARRLERLASGPSLEELVAQETERSHTYGGRSVFGWETPPTVYPKDSAAKRH